MTHNYQLFLRLIIIFTIVLSLFCSCSSHTDNDIKAVVKGNIKNADGRIIVLQELAPHNIVEVYSTVIDEDGNFTIKISELNETFYRLRIDENNSIHLCINSGDTIKITGKYPILPRTYDLTGSKDSRLLLEMNRELIKSTDELNKMQDEFITAFANPNINIDSLRLELTNKSNELYNRDRNYLINFIKENFKSPTIYVALYQHVLTNPILDIETDIDIFEFALESLEKYNPKLEQTVLLNSEVTKVQLRNSQITRSHNKHRVGDIAPDFSLSDKNGKTVTLSSFRGSYVLLHFWASWSSQSTKDIKYLVNLNNEINIENFEIIQISLDSNSDSWTRAIESEGAGGFVHLSDFKMWESPVTRVYGISSIPVNFLVDPKGNIIAININPEYFTKEIPKLITQL